MTFPNNFLSRKLKDEFLYIKEDITMGMTIRNNISSLNAQRILRNTLNDYNKSMEKLSSGYKINRAADDAAGLAISERMRTQIRGLKVASGNASNGIELCKTADGALEQVQNMLQRDRKSVV